MENLFFKLFNQPQCQYSANCVQNAIQTYFPSQLTYAYPHDPELDLRLQLVVGIASAGAADTHLEICVCRRESNEVLWRRLPARSAAHPGPAVGAVVTSAGGATPETKMMIKDEPFSFSVSPAAIRVERGTTAGHWRVFFSRRDRCLCVSYGRERLFSLRELMVALGVLTTDEELLRACLPFPLPRDDDAQVVHFAQSMRRATQLATPARRARAERFVAQVATRRVQTTWRIAAMVREWYLHYFSVSGSGSGSEAVAVAGLQLVRSRESDVAHDLVRLWRTALVPALDDALRRAAAIAAAPALLLAVEECWRSVCVPLLTPALDRWTTAFAGAREPRIRHCLFEMVSTEPAPEDTAALHAFLRAGGAGGAWCVRDLGGEDPAYFLEDHLDALTTALTAPHPGPEKDPSFPSPSPSPSPSRVGLGLGLEVWIDHLPYGYMTGAALHEWPTAFRRLFRAAPGARWQRAFFSFSLDWVRRRLDLFTCAGRLGCWYAVVAEDTGLGRGDDGDGGDNFETAAIARRRAEWIDYQSETRHVELGTTHRPIREDWADKTWWHLCRDVGTAGGDGGDDATAATNSLFLLPLIAPSALPEERPHPISLPLPGRMVGTSLLPIALRSNDLVRCSEQISVAVGCFDFEAEGGGGVVFNRASLDRGVLARTVVRKYALPPGASVRRHLRVGARVRKGDELAASNAPAVLCLEDGYVSAVAPAATEISVASPLSWTAEGTHPIEFVDRTGLRRWRIARVVPEHLMPFCAETGERADAVISPQAFDSQSEWTELLLAAATHSQHPWMSPRSGGRAVEESQRWLRTSLYVSVLAPPDVVVDAAAPPPPWEETRTTLIEVHPATGAHGNPRGIENGNKGSLVRVPRVWAETVWRRRILALGGHAYFFADSMLPFRQDLAGWSAASRARFEEDVATANDGDEDARERILADAMRRFGLLDSKSKSKSKSKSDSTNDEEEEEDANANANANATSSTAKKLVAFATATEGAAGGFLSPYPNVTFQFDAYWRSYSAPNDGVLHLQEQTRAYIEELHEELGGAANSAWRMNVQRNRFRHVLSGRVVPYIDARTLFLMQRRKKSATFRFRTPPPIAMDSSPSISFLAPRVPEKVPGVFEAGDVVLRLTEPMPAHRGRRWRVRQKQTDRVFVIELLPNEPTEGLSQLTAVALAEHLWHFDARTAAHPGLPAACVTTTEINMPPNGQFQVPAAYAAPEPGDIDIPGCASAAIASVVSASPVPAAPVVCLL